MSGFKAPNYTQVPNDFFDMIRDMDETELKATLIIMRETFGYHRRSAKVGIAEISRRAGISYNGASQGCEKAQKRGTIERTNPEAKTQAEWQLVAETPSASEGDFEQHPQPVREIPSASEGQVRLNKDKEKIIKDANLKVDAILQMSAVSASKVGPYFLRFSNPTRKHSVKRPR
jgi:hypothetical protein